MSATLTPEEIEAIVERHRQATPGIWMAVPASDTWGCPLENPTYRLMSDLGPEKGGWDVQDWDRYNADAADSEQERIDIEFAACAHQDIPALIATIESLRAHVASLSRPEVPAPLINDGRPRPYRHYKGEQYDLLAVVEREGDCEPMAVYCHAGTKRAWVRPMVEFNEKFAALSIPSKSAEEGVTTSESLDIPRQNRELARHALGLPNKNRQSYRNRFIANLGHWNCDAWVQMCAAGDAVQHSPFTDIPGDQVLFQLTRQGALKALSPVESLNPADFPIEAPTDG